MLFPDASFPLPTRIREGNANLNAYEEYRRLPPQSVFQKIYSRSNGHDVSSLFPSKNVIVVGDEALDPFTLIIMMTAGALEET